MNEQNVQLNKQVFVYNDNTVRKSPKTQAYQVNNTQVITHNKRNDQYMLNSVHKLNQDVTSLNKAIHTSPCNSFTFEPHIQLY